MSPEQARGGNVDRRAYFWAFGVILFEMLAGQRLFEGATIPDMLGVGPEERSASVSAASRDAGPKSPPVGGGAWRRIDENGSTPPPMRGWRSRKRSHRHRQKRRLRRLPLHRRGRRDCPGRSWPRRVSRPSRSSSRCCLAVALQCWRTSR